MGDGPPRINMSTNPKYVIECQQCRGSLTIILSAHGAEWEKPGAIEEHLATLMATHVSMIPGPQHEKPPGTPDKKKEYVTKVRPL